MLASAFLIYDWLYFSIGSMLSMYLVMYYFVMNFGLHFQGLCPSLFMNWLACVFVAYHVELTDKTEFLEMKQTEFLQKDLKKVL